MMRKKILLIGNIEGAYRSQITIKHLLDFRGNDEYCVDFVLDSFYISKATPCSGLMKHLRRVYAVLLKLLSLLSVCIKAGFSDIIYVLPLNHGWMPIVLIANLIWRRPVISDIYVSRYDTGLDWGIYTDTAQLRARYDRYLDRLMIERSAKVIFSTTSDLDYITKLVDARPTIDNSLIIPLAVERRQLASPEKSGYFRLCWWGTWLPVHGIKNILEAAKIMIDGGAEVTLDMLGMKNENYYEYAAMISDLGLNSNVTMHLDKTFSNGRLEEFLIGKCDLVIGMFGNSQKARHSLPNKILEGFSMKLPVLTMKSTALQEFIDVDNEIFVCDTAPEDIAKAVLEIKHNPSESARRAELGYQRYLMTFTPERFCTGIERAISMVR